MFQKVYQIHLYRSQRGDCGLPPLPIAGTENLEHAAVGILQSYHDNPNRDLQHPPLRGDVIGEHEVLVLTVEIGPVGARVIWRAKND